MMPMLTTQETLLLVQASREGEWICIVFCPRFLVEQCTYTARMLVFSETPDAAPLLVMAKLAF